MTKRDPEKQRDKLREGEANPERERQGNVQNKKEREAYRKI